MKSTAGVQQGDPLSPLLFSLVVLELLDTIGQVEGLVSTVWYLDDGTFVGTRDAIASLLDKMQTHGPNLGLHLNLSKCKFFGPPWTRTLLSSPQR